MDAPTILRTAARTGALIPIGQLAREAGCKVQTVRWYEEVGLLPSPARTEGGHRLYGRPHRERLAFIRHAREFGFGLEAIRKLLDLAARPERPCTTLTPWPSRNSPRSRPSSGGSRPYGMNWRVW